MSTIGLNVRTLSGTGLCHDLKQGTNEGPNYYSTIIRTSTTTLTAVLSSVGKPFFFLALITMFAQRGTMPNRISRVHVAKSGLLLRTRHYWGMPHSAFGYEMFMAIVLPTCTMKWQSRNKNKVGVCMYADTMIKTSKTDLRTESSISIHVWQRMRKERWECQGVGRETSMYPTDVSGDFCN